MRTSSGLRRKRQALPAFALVARGLLAAYRRRQAKHDSTKQNRLAQMLAELAGGRRYMRMAWRPGR